MEHNTRILIGMKKTAKIPGPHRLHSFFEGLSYLFGSSPIKITFPEIKPPEKMVREAWENTGFHLAESMDKAAKEHHLAHQ